VSKNKLAGDLHAYDEQVTAGLNKLCVAVFSSNDLRLVADAMLTAQRRLNAEFKKWREEHQGHSSKGLPRD